MPNNMFVIWLNTWVVFYVLFIFAFGVFAVITSCFDFDERKIRSSRICKIEKLGIKDLEIGWTNAYVFILQYCKRGHANIIFHSRFKADP